MNIAFGWVPLAASGSTAPPCPIFASDQSATVAGAPSFPFRLDLQGDDGAVLGSAADDDGHLVYLGAILPPLDGWRDPRSPLVDPDATARFLLAAYRERGEAFLDGINGQYAVAVIDRSRRRLLLAADPAGGRSWFIHQAEGRVAFASHLLTLARGLGPDLRIDRGLEDFFLIHGFYPHGRTPYAGVESVPPGRLLDWRDGEFHTREIPPPDPWRAAAEAEFDPAGSELEEVERLYDAMVRATREQLPAQPQKVAVLLGGFDSALVAAIIHRLGYEVETFSFHYQEQAYNQPHTDTLAAHLGIKHHWIEIDRDCLEDGLRTFPETFSQPTNWPNYTIQTARLCDEIRRRGIHHCYSGDGCDAVFMGYPGTYRRARVFGALPTLPRPVMKILLALAARPLLERIFGHPYRVALNILRGFGRRMPARGYLSFRIMDEVSLRQLRAEPPPPPERPLDDLVEELSRPHAGLSVLRLAFLGKAAVSPNRNKLIGSSDRAGVTILAPYMQTGLKHLALSLPDELLRPEEKTRSQVTGKYILMKMAKQKGLLPPEIIYQDKVAAVDAPVDDWYAGPMRSFLLDLFDGLPFRHDRAYVDRLIDRKWAEDLFKEYVMSDRVISHAVSLLATYAAFCAVAKGDDEPT